MPGVPCVAEVGVEDGGVAQESEGAESQEHHHAGELRHGKDVLDQLAPGDAVDVGEACQQDDDEGNSLGSGER